MCLSNLRAACIYEQTPEGVGAASSVAEPVQSEETTREGVFLKPPFTTSRAQDEGGTWERCPELPRNKCHPPEVELHLRAHFSASIS